LGSNNPDLTDNYTFTENINAEYLQFKFKLMDRLQVLGGCKSRKYHTKLQHPGAFNFQSKYGNIAYTDVLPSLHLDYTLSDKQNLRLSLLCSSEQAGLWRNLPYNIDGEY